MMEYGPAIAAVIFLASAPVIGRGQADERVPALHPPGGQQVSAPRSNDDEPRDTRSADAFGIVVRPGTLADHIDSLAGKSVRVLKARVVGVFEPRVFLIETQTALRPAIGNRDRVLVFVEHGALRVAAESLVASTVTVSGIARTLLGMQVTQEVPWPAVLTRKAVERLEIRVAVLADSVETSEGVDLTIRDRPASTAAHRSPLDRRP